MTDDVPDWFGEQSGQTEQPVNPPTAPVDWFGDIESDEFPTPASGAEGTEVGDATRDVAVNRNRTSEVESATSDAGQGPATEMDGERETTATEMNADSTADGSGGGFVAWLKSLFGLGK
jgi:hypothetical protein